MTKMIKNDEDTYDINTIDEKYYSECANGENCKPSEE